MIDQSIKKVLVIGSGPIIIGQAAEFDYAGTQACRSLHEEGVEVVLVNSNPATIMTDKDIADKVYIEPLTIPTVRRVLEVEKPDSILPTLGGQTGLNLAMELEEKGILKELGVRLIGINADAIKKAEDRQAFKDTMFPSASRALPPRWWKRWRMRWNSPPPSVIRSSSARPIRLAAPAAASRMMKRNCARSRTTASAFPAWGRCSLSAVSRAGRKLNTR